MIKRFFWILVIFILIFIVCGIVYLKFNKINISFLNKVEVCFIYENNDTTNQLNNQEIEIIKAIFNKKIMHKENYSCGFSENISIKLNDQQTFCIARDSCPIIYWKEKNRYIKISDDEKNQLYTLLKPYGFFFPCI